MLVLPSPPSLRLLSTSGSPPFAATLCGIWICGAASLRLGVHDHPGIVWDEFAGFLITMTAVPMSWQTVLAGFLLFRFFDILKPWPIGWLDKKVAGGFGIMLDDIVAGAMAWFVLQLILNMNWLG